MRGKILLARERMELDFINAKEDVNCGSEPDYNLA
jgi:hypothetical protein